MLLQEPRHAAHLQMRANSEEGIWMVALYSVSGMPSLRHTFGFSHLHAGRSRATAAGERERALLAVDVHELELKVGDAVLGGALEHEGHAVAVVLRLLWAHCSAQKQVLHACPCCSRAENVPSW